MNVLVDTSVWVDFFNGYASAEAQRLARLIEDEDDIATCGVVVAEFLQGLRNQDDVASLESHFRDMRWLEPAGPETYVAAAALFRGLRRQGVTIRSTIDCLIARLAEEHEAFVLAKDRDLRLILESGLCVARAVP